MTAKEIIADLSNLNRAELEAIAASLHELLTSPTKEPNASSPKWGKGLAKLSGTVEGLPSDYALNHDHYVHGARKRSSASPE